LAAGGCASDATALPKIDSLRCADTVAAPAAPSSLPALAGLGTEERRALHGTLIHAGHGHGGPDPPIREHGATETALARQIQAAAQIACEFRSPDDAVRAGYRLSSVFDQGVGTHWTNWRLIDAPFDPTRPSMLLYAPRLGTTQLVGFSYWVRTSEPTGPVGFAGNADHWHRHYGLCFDETGLLQRENVRRPALCRGVYLNGEDMWMLHAWVVPGTANVWGLFADLNPQLCNRNVADIERCPGLQ
jgi:hypothetical protein